MYKRILVPLDGSRFSEEIIPHAVGLAAIHGTELALLRVVSKAADEDDARAYIDRLAAAHGARGLCLLAPGDVVPTLLKETNREPATLLAMTSRGHSGLAEILLGSVAQRVMRSLKGPVLIYRPTGARHLKHLPIKFGSIVLPLDGSDASEAIASNAAEFARWIRADLEVISVIPPVKMADVGEVSGGEMVSMESGYLRSKANQLAKRCEIRTNWDALRGDPAKAIVDYVSKRQDTILAMTTRREDALEAAILGSVTAYCLRNAGVPILMRLP